MTQQQQQRLPLQCDPRTRTSVVRRRIRPFVCCALLFATPTYSFTVSPQPSPLVSRTESSSTMPGLHAVPQQRTRNGHSSMPQSSSPRSTHLSNTAQRELLDQVHEMRRIQQIEQELTVSTAQSTVTPLQLSRATGYDEAFDIMETAVQQGEVAREQLITTNMGLVRHVVQDIVRHRPRLASVTTEDLVQEGVIGLVRAMDRWNPEIGTAKFSTYAVFWIRAVVLRCIAEKDSVIRLPSHVSSAVSKVTRAARTFGLTEGASWREAAAAKELAEAAGVSEKQLQEVIKIKNRQILSYETWAEIERATASHEEARIIDGVDGDVSSTKDTLSRFLGPREVEAISWRYGLNTNGDPSFPGGKWGESMSFAQVGKQMQVSAEYGRRLCHKALNKLRAAAEEGSLEPALLSL